MSTLDPERTKLALEPDGILDTAFGPTRFEQLDVGGLFLPSGRIVACDGFVCFDEPAFERVVPPGRYAATLSIAHTPGGDQRIALATIRFAPAPPTSWQMALRPGQSASRLKSGEFFGYSVDSGNGCFASPEALARVAIERSSDVLYERLAAEMHNNYQHTREWANVELEPAGANMILFTSGLGDGVYGSHWGLSDGGEVVCLTTDFGLIEPPGDEPEPGADDPWFRRWMPTFFGPGTKRERPE